MLLLLCTLLLLKLTWVVQLCCFICARHSATGWHPNLLIVLTSARASCSLADISVRVEMVLVDFGFTLKYVHQSTYTIIYGLKDILWRSLNKSVCGENTEILVDINDNTCLLVSVYFSFCFARVFSIILSCASYPPCHFIENYRK